MSLDRLVSLMNVHGVSPRDVPGGGIPDLTQLDAFAALGFHGLSLQAYLIGLAVYTDDQKAINGVTSWAVCATQQMFLDERWNARKAYATRYNKAVQRGELTEAEAGLKAEVYAKLLPERLATLAVSDVIDSQRCTVCNGTAYVNTQACPHCQGHGKRTVRDKDLAAHCDIQTAAWSLTWKPRYQKIRHLVRGWLQEFELHLQEKCR